MRAAAATALRDFVAAEGVRLDSALRANEGLRTFLANALHGRRLLMVGEPDHWIAQKSSYRMMLARAGAALGFSWFGDELGWSDGWRLDGYLRDGDAQVLERISYYGYRGDLRRDRDDSPTGILARPAGDTERAFAADHRRFVQGLRRALTRPRPLRTGAQPRSVRLFGFDVDGVPGGAYADVRRMATDMGIRLPGAVWPVADESIDAEIARLDRVVRGAATLPLPVRQALETLRDSLAYVRLAHPAASYEALRPAMAQRERVMLQHVERVLDALPPGTGLTLWGHNLHLARDDTALPEQPGAGPGGDCERSLGHMLNRRLGQDVYTVWLVCGEGRDLQPFTELTRQLAPPPDSLNAALAAVGGNFLIPTRSRHPADQALVRSYSSVA